jgi:hypothetical protein
MELRLFIIFLVIILILYWLYLYKKIKVEQFSNIDLPYHIWLYWENKENSTKPEYLSLCYETIVKNCGEKFKVHLLDENTIYEYLPNINKDFLKKLTKIPMKADYIRYQLLYHYGGIWLDTDVLVFKNLDYLLQKLVEYEYVGFGCHYAGTTCLDGYPKPANWTMISRPKSKLLYEITHEADDMLTRFDADYFIRNYHILGRKLLWKSIQKCKDKYHGWDYLHISSKCIERDSTGVKISNQMNLSVRKIDKNCEKKMFFLPIYNTAPGFPKWFLDMTKSELLNSNMLISNYFKYALNI